VVKERIIIADGSAWIHKAPYWVIDIDDEVPVRSRTSETARVLPATMLFVRKSGFFDLTVRRAVCIIASVDCTKRKMPLPEALRRASLHYTATRTRALL
jgi:hypothetical protein